MASPYESYKVRELVTAYRSDPTMFTDDQLDQLEALAYDNGINFKRINSEFNLNRAVRQAQAGFIEGFSTFDLIPESPRNTGEAIFRQLGHLAGFAPGILKAPVMGLSKIAQRVTGKKTRNQFTESVLEGIGVLDRYAAPMIASRGAKTAFNATIDKVGGRTLEFMKRGSSGRAIAEEAIGLGTASALSNIWKGEDAIIDGFIGGAIAGGAFGTIGNFASIGNRLSAGRTPQQIESANQALRGLLGSAFQGLPSTLRNEPTEMQIYNYLLGGFFGYNARPAKDIEASKWLSKNRDPSESFTPERSSDWNTINKEARDYITYEHPMGFQRSNNEAGGSSGIALGYLKNQNPNRNYRQDAETHFKRNNINYTEKDINDFYRNKATEVYQANVERVQDFIVLSKSIPNQEMVDMMDPAIKPIVDLNNISRNILKANKDYKTNLEVGDIIVKTGQSINKDVNQFISQIKQNFTINKNIEKKLKNWYHESSKVFQPMPLMTIDGNNISVKEITKERINNVSIGEKTPELLPIQIIHPKGNIQMITHVIKDNIPVKIFKQSKNPVEQIEYALNKKDLGLINSKLGELDSYIFSGNKDKLTAVKANFRDGNYTINEVLDVLSRGNVSRSELQNKYDNYVAREKEIFGDTPATVELAPRKFISNIIYRLEQSNLPFEQAYRLIEKDSPYAIDPVNFNKRIQLLLSRMEPMHISSFKDVPFSNEGKVQRILIVKDPEVPFEGGSTINKTDGSQMVLPEVLKAEAEFIGLDPKVTGSNKPVIVFRTENGLLATKSNGQEMLPAMEKFARDNNIHRIFFESSVKLMDNNRQFITDLKYDPKKGSYSADNIRTIEVPTEAVQISRSTYENLPKDVNGTTIALQAYNNMNLVQGDRTFSKLWFEQVIEPSLKGTTGANELTSIKDSKEFIKKYDELNMNIEHMPYEFMKQKLLKQRPDDISIFLADRIMKAEREGQLNDPMSERIEYDNDSNFKDLHIQNNEIAKAVANTYIARNTLSFANTNYHNTLRKYFTRRITNPFIETGMKSWFKGFIEPEATQYIEFDPFKRGNRTIEEGEVYLDTTVKQMPVVFGNKKYSLGELWNKYTREYSDGLSKEVLKQYDDAFTFLVIRTPADSVSGVRALRFRGWTGQKGAGSLIHPKDKEMLGGGDNDSDSMKIFQGFKPDLLEYYKKNKDERARWSTDKPYVDRLNELVRNKNISKELGEELLDPFYLMSSAHRVHAGRYSSTGKDGLGLGLANANYMLNYYDYINSIGGTYKYQGLVVKTKDKFSHRFALDLKTMIVNKSADASKDPTKSDYTKDPDLLFDALFEVSYKGKPLNSVKLKGQNPNQNPYTKFNMLISGSNLDAIKKSIRLTKPNITTYETGEPAAIDIFQYKRNLNEVKQQMDSIKKGQVNLDIYRKLQESFGDSIEFGGINKVQQALYRKSRDNYINNLRQQYEEFPKQFLVKSNTSKYLEKHFDILAKELSFETTSNHQKNMATDPNKALDIFGKDIGQYATIELLTKQFGDIQKAFLNKGKKVNLVDDVYPKLKEEAFAIKDTLKVRDNKVSNDLDGRIMNTRTKLSNIEKSNGLQEGLLQDYFSYWLLSPIQRNPSPTKVARTGYSKDIHASRAIPIQVKRNFYKKLDEIYFDVLGDKPPITIKSKKFKDSELSNNVEINEVLDTSVNTGVLKGLALTKKDLAEVNEFSKYIKDHPISKENFNDWFTQMTSPILESRILEGPTRDATTITLKDVKALNNYFRELQTKKGLGVGLIDYYSSPITTSRKLEAMNFQTKAFNIKQKVLTKDGLKEKNVQYVLSPILSIANYIRMSEAGINKYEGRRKDMRFNLEKELNELDTKKEKIYMDNIIEFREGRKTLDQLDKSINKEKFIKLNEAVTEFNKNMWEFWVPTKNAAGKEYNWNTIDVNNNYGVVNKYIRYDKNGRFNLEKFEQEVIMAKNQSDNIIRQIGIDGIMRYRYEYLLEKSIAGSKNKKEARELARKESPFYPRRKRDYNTYIHHSIRNVPKNIRIEQVEWINRNAGKIPNRVLRELTMDNEFFEMNDRITIDADYKTAFENSSTSIPGSLKKRGNDPIPFKRGRDLFDDYQNSLIKGYFRNLMKVKAQSDIDALMSNMKNYKPSKNETARFNKMYKGQSIPDKLRYKNYLDVWADFVRNYAEYSMGYQTKFSDKMMTEQGRDLLALNKKNLFYTTSDQVIANQLEKLYRSKLGGRDSLPFVNNLPKDPAARQPYLYNLIRNLGASEAKYQLLSLLANTGSFTTNIFGGGTLAIGSAGVRNFVDSFNNKTLEAVLLKNSKGEYTTFLNNGKPVKNRKGIDKWLEENGFFDNYIQNEFEYRPEVTARLKNAGVNIKNLSRDLVVALKSKRTDKQESVNDVFKRYGINDIMLEAGGFFMKSSERINRKNAFIAHALQAVRGFGKQGREMTLNDPYVFQQAMKGIEMTQFLYQNAFRPPFMATTTGKVLNRFKLFAFNSVRIRKEFFRQAKMQGLRPNTEEYKRFQDTFLIDIMMYGLGAAFMFSLFDTTLPPPYDWVQALADYTFGTKQQKELAYFGDPLGPLNVLKPPIARVPEAFGELITGNFDDFTGYTMYTLLPFGRGIRQAVQLSDDRVGRGLERAPEILFRIPYNKFLNRLERAKTKRERLSFIDELLEES